VGQLRSEMKEVVNAAVPVCHARRIASIQYRLTIARKKEGESSRLVEHDSTEANSVILHAEIMGMRADVCTARAISSCLHFAVVQLLTPCAFHQQQQPIIAAYSRVSVSFISPAASIILSSDSNSSSM
jgi:hypothetical protein